MYFKIKRKWIVFLIIFFIIIFISLIFFLLKFNKNSKNIGNSQSLVTIKNEIVIPKNDETLIEKEKIDNDKEIDEKLENNNDNKWRILISKINLDAPILEGTSSAILRKAVGHFENSSKWDGNVVLAAHNRGYRYNYFSKLKELEIGDSIIYQTEQAKRSYIVVKKEKIKETDLSCLENTNDNTLTLITCIENMPEYRLCIQAVLK